MNYLAGSGPAPRLGSSDPYFGNPAFQLEVLDTPANAACIFGLALGATSLPLGSGCSLLIEPFTLALAAANPSGIARTVAIAIPVHAALTGVSLHAQAIVADPQAPLGFTLTARRTLAVGQ